MDTGTPTKSSPSRGEPFSPALPEPQLVPSPVLPRDEPAAEQHDSDSEGFVSEDEDDQAAGGQGAHSPVVLTPEVNAALVKQVRLLHLLSPCWTGCGAGRCVVHGILLAWVRLQFAFCSSWWNFPLQIEFYFSDANLPSDKKLLKQIRKDPGGFGERGRGAPSGDGGLAGCGVECACARAGLSMQAL